MNDEPSKHTVMMSGIADDWSNEWMRQIGWIGYHFAQLEWASFWLAEHFGAKGFLKSITELPFVKRCIAVRKKVIQNIPDVNLRTEWKSLFVAMEASAAMRNKILHNPIEINLREMNERGICIDEGIRLMRDRGRVVTIGEVQHFTDGIMDLHQKMLNLMARTKPMPE